MDEQRCNYWAVIPGHVLYDKDLPPAARLLYGEISVLTNKEGFCYAGNAYFAEELAVSERTVERWIKALHAKGYIRIETARGPRNTVLSRRIYAGMNPMADVPPSSDKNVETDSVPTKMSVSSDKNVETNNDYITNTEKPPKAPQKGGRRAKGDRNVPEWKPERFLGFWNFYPKSAHKSKQAAVKAWDTLRPSDELIAEIGKALRRQMATEQWQRGIGIPYPSTYLRQRRWEDEAETPEDTGPDREDGPEWI